jgi:hypothetical protein
MSRSRSLLAVSCICAVPLVAGCGGDDERAAAPAATEAPESRIAPDAAVTAGLKGLVVVAEGISRLPDEAASKKASQGLEPVWMKVEGTVKQNEPDLYATIEEDLSLLESGDQAKTKAGAAEISETVDAYLAKHPG